MAGWLRLSPKAAPGKAKGASIAATKGTATCLDLRRVAGRLERSEGAQEAEDQTGGGSSLKRKSNHSGNIWFSIT